MKRFFCKVCKRVKRARRIPPQTTNPENTNPINRIGICHRHMNDATNHAIRHGKSSQMLDFAFKSNTPITVIKPIVSRAESRRQVRFLNKTGK